MRMGFLESRRRPALALGLAICGIMWGAIGEAGSGEVPTADPRAAVLRFTDALGHEIGWARPPQRIVSLSPSVTEILFAIGHDAQTIVGRTRFCTAPSAAAAVPSVGGIVDPSLEEVLLRQPDLVLATRGNPLEFMESLVHLGLPVYAIETRGGLRQILETISEVGAVTGRDTAAGQVAAELQDRIAEVRWRTQSLAGEDRARVYYGEIEGTHWTAGPESFIDDVITAAGGRNVGGIAPWAWGALSIEAIISQDPQVYLGTYAAEGRQMARARAERILAREPAWRDTQLGRNPRIFLVHEDCLQRPGPRVVDVLEEFARFLHPELWPDAPEAEAPESMPAEGHQP